MIDHVENRITEGALTGLKVLDLGEHISAPLTAKLLGAAGAEVIKVERPGCGDPSRRAGPFLNDLPHPERSALFLWMNTSKKGITLDLENQTGVSILKDLVKETDVLVENYQPGVMAERGLGYETLATVNPGLVMASITDFGQTGPYRHYKGDRLVDNALSGYMNLNGDPDREPLAGGGEQPAYQGGLYGYSGVMAALLARDATGKGQHIDVSSIECLASIHQFNVNRYIYSGMVQQRCGNRYNYNHPNTIYRCRDGYVSICPSAEEQLERLLILIDMVHLLDDPRFETGFHRLANAEAFDALVQPWFLERDRKEIVETCQEFRIPAAYVSHVDDLLQDAQYEARGYWIEIDHPEAGVQPYAAGPFKMSETPIFPGRAPLLGEHNEEIYCGLMGMHREDLVRMRALGII